ncbi:12971_t:CDS:2, partial [Entrophospora sp. SA101]
EIKDLIVANNDLDAADNYVIRLLADITRVFNQKKLQAIENIKQQLKMIGSVSQIKIQE